jgi:hypothetical protein
MASSGDSRFTTQTGGFVNAAGTFVVEGAFGERRPVSHIK